MTLATIKHEHLQKYTHYINTACFSFFNTYDNCKRGVNPGVDTEVPWFSFPFWRCSVPAASLCPCVRIEHRALTPTWAILLSLILGVPSCYAKSHWTFTCGLTMTRAWEGCLQGWSPARHGVALAPCPAVKSERGCTGCGHISQDIQSERGGGNRLFSMICYFKHSVCKDCKMGCFREMKVAHAVVED